MKKVIIGFCLLFSALAVQSQDVKRTFGVGLQSSFPSFGFSVKYAITERSVVQATIAPFGSSMEDVSVSMNFYGARYMYRFPDSDERSVSLDPYLFAGGGLLSYKSSVFGETSTENMFGYSLGGGVELIVAGKFGISAEVGYGKMSFTEGIAASTIVSGAGLHFYIR
jgi:hypothetical protein